MRKLTTPFWRGASGERNRRERFLIRTTQRRRPPSLFLTIRGSIHLRFGVRIVITQSAISLPSQKGGKGRRELLHTLGPYLLHKITKALASNPSGGSSRSAPVAPTILIRSHSRAARFPQRMGRWRFSAIDIPPSKAAGLHSPFQGLGSMGVWWHTTVGSLDPALSDGDEMGVRSFLVSIEAAQWGRFGTGLRRYVWGGVWFPQSVFFELGSRKLPANKIFKCNESRKFNITYLH